MTFQNLCVNPLSTFHTQDKKPVMAESPVTPHEGYNPHNKVRRFEMAQSPVTPHEGYIPQKQVTTPQCCYAHKSYVWPFTH